MLLSDFQRVLQMEAFSLQASQELATSLFKMYLFKMQTGKDFHAASQMYQDPCSFHKNFLPTAVQEKLLSGVFLNPATM